LDAVRLDSGDLAADSRRVRAALDAAGLTDVRILASGDVDEFIIAALVADGAPIDAFGVGTSIAVGAGSPARGTFGGALGNVYKAVWVEGRPQPATIKTAGDKSTRPGRKQVYRLGDYTGDVIALDAEPPPAGGSPLLGPVIEHGELVSGATPPLAEIVARAHANLDALPERWRALVSEEPYPVRFSEALQALRRGAQERHRGAGKGPAR